MSNKIVLCDSGVSKRFKNKVNTIDIGLDIDDENGHGSQIIEVMQKIIAPSNITSIKILNKYKECNLQDLLYALDKCCELKPQIVCLALAIDEIINNEDLSLRIKELFDSGVIVVSSLHNKMKYSIPAILPEVIGVKITDRLENGKFYYANRRIQCELYHQQIICESIDGIFMPFGGNSLACALFTTHVWYTLNVSKNLTYRQLESKFEEQRESDLIYHKLFNQTSVSDKDINSDDIYRKIDLANKMCNVLTDNHLLYDGIKDLEQLNNYLKTLNQYGLKINKNNLLRFTDFESTKTLGSYFSCQDVVI